MKIYTSFVYKKLSFVERIAANLQRQNQPGSTLRAMPMTAGDRANFYRLAPKLQAAPPADPVVNSTRVNIRDRLNSLAVRESTTPIYGRQDTFASPSPVKVPSQSSAVEYSARLEYALELNSDLKSEMAEKTESDLASQKLAMDALDIAESHKQTVEEQREIVRYYQLLKTTILQNARKLTDQALLDQLTGSETLFLSSLITPSKSQHSTIQMINVGLPSLIKHVETYNDLTSHNLRISEMLRASTETVIVRLTKRDSSLINSFLATSDFHMLITALNQAYVSYQPACNTARLDPVHFKQEQGLLMQFVAKAILLSRGVSLTIINTLIDSNEQDAFCHHVCAQLLALSPDKINSDDEEHLTLVPIDKLSTLLAFCGPTGIAGIDEAPAVLSSEGTPYPLVEIMNLLQLIPATSFSNFNLAELRALVLLCTISSATSNDTCLSFSAGEHADVYQALSSGESVSLELSNEKGETFTIYLTKKSEHLFSPVVRRRVTNSEAISPIPMSKLQPHVDSPSTTSIAKEEEVAEPALKPDQQTDKNKIASKLKADTDYIQHSQLSDWIPGELWRALPIGIIKDQSSEEFTQTATTMIEDAIQSIATRFSLTKALPNEKYGGLATSAFLKYEVPLYAYALSLATDTLIDEFLQPLSPDTTLFNSLKEELDLTLEECQEVLSKEDGDQATKIQKALTVIVLSTNRNRAVEPIN